MRTMLRVALAFGLITIAGTCASTSAAPGTKPQLPPACAPAGTVSVVGNVRHPATNMPARGLTVRRAIALAGGTTVLAWHGGTMVRRQTCQGIVQVRIDLRAILEGESPDFALAPGDVLYVPERHV
jgi:protein involved in polysaccharide export with SLBB domain